MWRNCQLWVAPAAERRSVVTQSQRLVPSVPSDTLEQCRPGITIIIYAGHRGCLLNNTNKCIGASSCRVCTWRAQARQASEDRRVVAASELPPATDHSRRRIHHLLQFVGDRRQSPV